MEPKICAVSDGSEIAILAASPDSPQFPYSCPGLLPLFLVLKHGWELLSLAYKRVLNFHGLQTIRLFAETLIRVSSGDGAGYAKRGMSRHIGWLLAH